MEKTRVWSENHQYEDVSSITGVKTDSLYFGCTIRDISKATLKNCCLDRSKLVPETIEEIAGVTFTANCHTFSGLEMNELSFDLMLLLLCKTKGNTQKRQAIIDKVLGRDRANELLRKMTDEF